MIEQQKQSDLNIRKKIDWKKNEQSLRDLWDYNDTSGIQVIKVPGEEKECVAEKVFENWLKISQIW